MFYFSWLQFSKITYLSWRFPGSPFAHVDVTGEKRYVASEECGKTYIEEAQLPHQAMVV